MSTNNVIERALEGVSDGAPVDWAALETDAPSQFDRECLRWLRMLGQIEELHRTTSDDLEASTLAATMDEPARAAPVVEMWGRYELHEMIGEGSFGAVYRAWDRQLESELAIKILHQKATDARLTANLLAEGRALAKIRHPNVVRVLGIESNGDRIGLCMDFVRGQTLDDVLKVQGPMRAEEAALVGQDVCEALAVVHREKFVHRDVKARNVVREHGGRFVLMDFGAGRDVSQTRAQTGDMIGTPLYMAPEVLDGAPASPSSDVYSVGVLLFHLVTGDFPVYGRSLDELRLAHRYGDRKLLTQLRPDLPAPFVRAVEHALATDPHERYKTAAAFLDDLRAVVRPKRESVSDELVRVFYGIYAVAGVVCFAALLGILTSRVFNHALGVSSFVNESVGDWVSWGAKSTLLPILIISVVLVVASHLAMVLRLLTHRSRPIGLVDAARRRIDNFLQRFRLNDAANAASVILVVTTASLTTAFWHFYPLVLASVGTIADASPADLALLSPANHLQHTHFRETFTLLALFSVTAWWTVLKFASRHGQKVSRSMVAGGAAVTILSVVLLSLPYRILRHNKFERATWSGYRCYVIGEGAADLLVFCPQAPVPRSYTVPRNDGALKRFAKPENIFTLLSPANSRAQGEKP